MPVRNVYRSKIRKGRRHIVVFSLHFPCTRYYLKQILCCRCPWVTRSLRTAVNSRRTQQIRDAREHEVPVKFGNLGNIWCNLEKMMILNTQTHSDFYPPPTDLFQVSCSSFVCTYPMHTSLRVLWPIAISSLDSVFRLASTFLYGGPLDHVTAPRELLSRF